MSIRENAQAALRQSPRQDIRGLKVVQFRSAIVLHGHVNSFYHKQLAQELIKSKIDGAELVNEAEVIYRHEGD
jgi:BON domain